MREVGRGNMHAGGDHACGRCGKHACGGWGTCMRGKWGTCMRESGAEHACGGVGNMHAGGGGYDPRRPPASRRVEVPCLCDVFFGPEAWRVNSFLYISKTKDTHPER